MSKKPITKSKQELIEEHGLYGAVCFFPEVFPRDNSYDDFCNKNIKRYSEIDSIMIPLYLSNRVKHPECVERIVIEFEDGSETDDFCDMSMSDKFDLTSFSSIPENAKAFRIEYKKGPCTENCPRLEALKKQGVESVESNGCYNGRVDRIEVSEISDKINSNNKSNLFF